MSELTERPNGGATPPADAAAPSSDREQEVTLSGTGGTPAADRRAPEPGSDAERVATLYAQARAHSDAGETTAAVTAYRQLLKIDPKHARARNNLALLLERRGNVQGALEELELAIAAEPDNVSLLLNRAAVLSSHLRFEQAEQDLRRALRFGETAETLTNLGMVLSKGGRAREAVEPLRRAVDLAPNNAAAYYYLAEVYNRLDQLPAALAAYEQAAALQPSNWRAYKGVGNVLDRMGRPAEASVAHRKAQEAQRRS
ncbi:MAG: tetratricopeptide repeat protein [Gemmatimonadaceae bacterium]